ncbi:MAG: metal ABC transporter ATP-binding protein [Hyphomicrobium sp.]
MSDESTSIGRLDRGPDGHGHHHVARQHAPGPHLGPHDDGHHHAHGAECGCGHTHALPADLNALISARALCFTRGGRSIISNVDLDVAEGEIVTIIGPNGAGKSTLVKLLVGIERPDSGAVHRNARLRIGYVPQSFDVARALPMTVSAFLALGTDATAGAIRATLQEVGAERAAGQQLADLSGGETQRVLIARALLRKPTLLVLDEPARGVDAVGEAELYDLINAIKTARGLGVLLVSHDLHVVMAQSDRVVCLNGHVCCSGRPEAVSQHSDYVRLFGPQAARALAVYHHHHDHSHDLAGHAHPISGTAGASLTPSDGVPARPTNPDAGT